jgi:hypothetical protein
MRIQGWGLREAQSRDKDENHTDFFFGGVWNE